MTNEANTPEAIYVSPAVLCRITLTPEEVKVESATVDRADARALLVFRNEEEAEDYRREVLYSEEGLKALPADDDMLRYLLELHRCTDVLTPNSWLGEDRADFFSARNFMRLLEESVPA